MMNILMWLFESSLLIVMILGIRKIFTGKIPYSAVYALWGIVLVRLVLPVNVLSTHLSLENIFAGEQIVSVGQNTVNGKKGYPGEADGSTAGANTTNDALIAASANDLLKDTQGQERRQEDSYKEVKEGEYADSPIAGSGTGPEEKKMMSAVFTEDDVAKKILFVLWLSAASGMFFWLFFSNLRFLRKVKNSRILLGSRGRVKIYAADVSGSCLYGVLKPSVYLPQFLVGGCLEKDCEGTESLISLIEKNPQLSQIIVHELTHYRHGDHIWAMVRTALLVVYWFNPFVWLAVQFSRKDAELCCDEATIRQIGEEKRFDYGEMLIRLAGGAGQERFLYSAVFMSRRGKDMEKRIRAISQRKQYSRWLAVPLIILLLAAVGITCSRAVGGSKQADNTAGSGTSKTTEDMEKETAEQENLKESQMIYQSFLKENKKEKQYRYYSLAELGEGQYVLMVTDSAMEVDTDEDDNSLWSANSCQVYCIISGNVVSCGKIACSSSGEWIHLLADAETGDRRLVTNAHHSISRYSLEQGKAQLLEDTREEYEESQEKEYQEWYDELSTAPSVVFYTNPAVEKVKKNEPEALELTGDTVDVYKKRILSHLTAELGADITGDGIQDTIRVKFDEVEEPSDDTAAVTVISGKSGNTVYGIHVSLVHPGWNGVYLYRSGEHTSLMTWQPVMYQGIANYHWEIFDVSEDGEKTILAQDSFAFDLNNVKADDPEKLEEFVENLNFYLKDANRVVDTNDGIVLEGGASDYDRGGHYKGEFDEEGNWKIIYTAEQELEVMRETLTGN